MYERAVPAQRRLAALPILTVALAPAGASPPPWQARFDAEARSRSIAQALLRLRVKALEFEAEQARLLLC